MWGVLQRSHLGLEFAELRVSRLVRVRVTVRVRVRVRARVRVRVRVRARGGGLYFHTLQSENYYTATSQAGYSSVHPCPAPTTSFVISIQDEDWWWL